MKLRLVKQRDHVRRAFSVVLEDHPLLPSVAVEVSSRHEDATLAVSRGLRALVMRNGADPDLLAAAITGLAALRSSAGPEERQDAERDLTAAIEKVGGRS